MNHMCIAFVRRRRSSPRFVGATGARILARNRWPWGEWGLAGTKLYQNSQSAALAQKVITAEIAYEAPGLIVLQDLAGTIQVACFDLRDFISDWVARLETLPIK